jgi:hypothetical protein
MKGTNDEMGRQILGFGAADHFGRHRARGAEIVAAVAGK